MEVFEQGAKRRQYLMGGKVTAWAKAEDDVIVNNIDKTDEELRWLLQTHGYKRTKCAVEKRRVKLGYHKLRGSRPGKISVPAGGRQYHVKWASLQLHD